MGEVRAFINACAHRHARVTGTPRGNAVRLRCQVHGWEYDGRGAVCKIPDAACFVPVRRGSERLTALRAKALGSLIFVSLADLGPSLEEHLGEATTTLAAQVFPAAQRAILETTFEHPCNWKIPLENVLESYHVPFLHDNVLARHPELFRVFGGRRDGATLAHDLGERHTAYHDSLGADSRAYRALLRVLRPSASVDYVHHHAFPNVVIGHTSIVSYLQVVEPLSATTSQSTIRLFLDAGGPSARWVERALAPQLDRAAERLIRRVMAEDSAIYPDVQRGMAASPHAGVLGSREERIHHFQAWIAAATRP
jgi:phenylpropionate dioxygenase-like ring-hydroxylating dioxygenase large terminal subunit